METQAGRNQTLIAQGHWILQNHSTSKTSVPVCFTTEPWWWWFEDAGWQRLCARLFFVHVADFDHWHCFLLTVIVPPASPWVARLGQARPAHHLGLISAPQQQPMWRERGISVKHDVIDILVIEVALSRSLVYRFFHSRPSRLPFLSLLVILRPIAVCQCQGIEAAISISFASWDIFEGFDFSYEFSQQQPEDTTISWVVFVVLTSVLMGFCVLIHHHNILYNTGLKTACVYKVNVS